VPMCVLRRSYPTNNVPSSPNVTPPQQLAPGVGSTLLEVEPDVVLL
jgi:hypothetical protein